MQRMLFTVALSGSLLLILEVCAMDISVKHIEATQGIQDQTNSIPLVAGRSAAVRVTVAAAPAGAAPSVTGKLEVLVNGLASPGLTFVPVNLPFTVPVTADPKFENHTLNFELTNEEFLKIPEGVPVELRVTLDAYTDPSTGIVESELTNNTATLGPLVFMRLAIQPRFFYVLIDYRPKDHPALGLPPAALVAPSKGDAMVRGVLPLRDQDPELYQSFPLLDTTAGIIYSEHSGTGTIQGGEAEAKLFKLLDDLRWTLISLKSLDPETTYLFGWLPEKAISGARGLSFGKTGFGTVEPAFYQRVYAHELTHQLGICDHNTRRLSDTPSSQPGWDVGGRLWNNPPENKVADSVQVWDPKGTGRAKRLNLRDVMDSGQSTSGAWVDIQTYKDLLTPEEMRCYGAAADLVLENGARSTVVVQGWLNADGTQVEGLFTPVFQYAAPSRPVRVPRSSKLVVEVSDAERRHVSRLPLAVPRPDERNSESPPVSGFFSVRVPFSGERVASVRILEADTDKELKVVSVPADAPKGKVKLASPSPDPNVKDSIALAWEMINPEGKKVDSREGTAAHVAFSPDGGQTWTVLGVNCRDAKLMVDKKRLAALGVKEKRGIIRVLASDGSNTTMDEVSGLSFP